MSTEATKADRLREERDWWQSTCIYWKETADAAIRRIEGLSAGFETACARLDAMDAEIERLRPIAADFAEFIRRLDDDDDGRAAVVETPEVRCVAGTGDYPDCGHPDECGLPCAVVETETGEEPKA